jgi:hypothetical protein
MAQLFSFILRLFYRKSATQLMLEYNVSDLSAKMQRLSVELYRCRVEDSIKVLAKVVDTARNIQLLEVNRAKPEAFQHHMGRLEALTDLATFIEHSLDPAVYEQRKAKETGPKPRILMKNNQRSEAII